MLIDNCTKIGSVTVTRNYEYCDGIVRQWKQKWFMVLLCHYFNWHTALSLTALILHFRRLLCFHVAFAVDAAKMASVEGHLSVDVA